MSKAKISETKKTTHKLATEGTISINTDNTIDIDVPEVGLKKLHEVIKNFSGQYVKFSVQVEDQEEIIS